MTTAKTSKTVATSAPTLAVAPPPAVAPKAPEVDKSAARVQAAKEKRNAVSAALNLIAPRRSNPDKVAELIAKLEKKPNMRNSLVIVAKLARASGASIELVSHPVLVETAGRFKWADVRKAIVAYAEAVNLTNGQTDFVVAALKA